jgi:hypothetical protein
MINAKEASEMLKNMAPENKVASLEKKYQLWLYRNLIHL